ncbi:hypothetical protein [Marinomonas pollencensis]|uniref:Uncharacterized protein n=1 Tax=Marinomonas pollencensis TaxID=491954 RepID=A0A3E0DN18_9GAMM|nr:hypothetical protein [Marinomonas pollencensis]REG82897.1 hypothetical protein DFP81_10771 [Marinomonas pollencensis]
MAKPEVVYVTANNAGNSAGIFACVLAALGIFTLSVVFVPLAAIVAICGLVSAILQVNVSGIGLNLFAWLLIVVGIVTSPVLIAFMLMLGGILHLTP